MWHDIIQYKLYLFEQWCLQDQYLIMAYFIIILNLTKFNWFITSFKIYRNFSLFTLLMGFDMWFFQIYKSLGISIAIYRNSWNFHRILKKILPNGVYIQSNILQILKIIKKDESDILKSILDGFQDLESIGIQCNGYYINEEEEMLGIVAKFSPRRFSKIKNIQQWRIRITARDIGIIFNKLGKTYTTEAVDFNHR